MKLIPAIEVLRRLGCKGSSLSHYPWIVQNPDFPKPYIHKDTGVKGWDSDEIDAFVNTVKEKEKETLSAKDIAEKWGCSIDYIYSMEKRFAGFPRSFVLRGKKRWNKKDIDEYSINAYEKTA